MKQLKTIMALAAAALFAAAGPAEADEVLVPAGITAPAAPGETLFTVDLVERAGLPALATSGGYGMHFDPERRHHHLFDPGTGRSVAHHASVSVAAQGALLADGLSTALAATPPERCARLIDTYGPARAFLVGAGGAVTEHGPH